MKKGIIIIPVAIILAMAGISWVFPYSILSLNKSITYNQDNVVVDQYLESLQSFKEIYETKQGDKDLTTDRLQYMMEFYQSSSLTTRDTVKVSQQDLDITLFELKQITETLMDLAFSEDYDNETKEYLKLTLKSCLSLEEEIESLINPTFDSRKVIKTRISNLHGGLMANFNYLVTFYEQYKGGRQ